MINLHYFAKDMPYDSSYFLSLFQNKSEQSGSLYGGQHFPVALVWAVTEILCSLWKPLVYKFSVWMRPLRWPLVTVYVVLHTKFNYTTLHFYIKRKYHCDKSTTLCIMHFCCVLNQFLFLLFLKSCRFSREIYSHNRFIRYTQLHG